MHRSWTFTSWYGELFDVVVLPRFWMVSGFADGEVGISPSGGTANCAEALRLNKGAGLRSVLLGFRFQKGRLSLFSSMSGK